MGDGAPAGELSVYDCTGSVAGDESGEPSIIGCTTTVGTALPPDPTLVEYRDVGSLTR